MAISVFAVHNRVRNLIHDTEGVRWSDDELLDWVNDAQHELVRHVPSAYTLRVARALPLGTRHSLAGLGVTDGHAVLDVVANVGADDVLGRSVTQVERALLDRQNPYWSKAVGPEVLHWAADPTTPKDFYVYPGLARVGGRVEIVYAAVPPVLSSTAQSLVLDDVFAVALGYYVAFRAYSKDIEAAANQAAAASYYNLFLQSLGKGA